MLLNSDSGGKPVVPQGTLGNPNNIVIFPKKEIPEPLNSQRFWDFENNAEDGT